MRYYLKDCSFMLLCSKHLVFLYTIHVLNYVNIIMTHWYAMLQAWNGNKKFCVINQIRAVQSIPETILSTARIIRASTTKTSCELLSNIISAYLFTSCIHRNNWHCSISLHYCLMHVVFDKLTSKKEVFVLRRAHKSN